MKNKIYQANDCIERVHPLLSWIVAGSRVLEFGSARGGMTRYMKEQLNCQVVCLEINPEMAEHAAFYAEKMIVCDLEEEGWEKEIIGKFDYILFADVLEHLKDPETILQKSLRFLSAKGTVLTSIPNIAHSAIIIDLMSGKFSYQQFGLLDDTHVHFFTRESMEQMMDKCSLVCLKEKNIILPPGATEFRKFYWLNPFKALLLFWRKDIHVYQFVNAWGFKQGWPDPPKIKKRQSLGKIMLTLGDDMNAYLFYKFNYKMKFPPFIKKIIRK